MQPKFQRKKAPPRWFFCQIKRETPLPPEWLPSFFTFPLSRGYAFPPFRRPAAAGERGPPGMGDVRHDMACALPPPGGGGTQEGEREPYGALAPFCPGRWAPASPPPDGGISAGTPTGRLVFPRKMLHFPLRCAHNIQYNKIVRCDNRRRFFKSVSDFEKANAEREHQADGHPRAARCAQGRAGSVHHPACQRRGRANSAHHRGF